VYQSDGQPGFYYYNGTDWVGFASGQAVSVQGAPVVSANYGLTYTLAGNGAVGSGNGPALTASFNQPFGIAVDGVGNIYISDTYNNIIRKMTPDGTVALLAGSGAAGSADGQGTAASFNQPAGIAVDLAGNLYVADQGNSKIRKITPGGLVSTYAGNGTIGNVNGNANLSTFYFPQGVAVDVIGNVYVADTYNQEIRKISTDGFVSIVAGYAGQFGAADGTGTDASFKYPSGIVVSADGNLYVADEGNNEIRKVTTGGVVTTLAATGFNSPAGIAADATGNLYISEVGNQRVRKLTGAGVVSTVSGSGVAGFADGPAGVAKFNGPYGIAVDRAGNIYVADAFNNRIRKIIVQ
jgi:sugar lactone lactonase YvrE